MSYCRWSSDDWQCDVYVWADVDGGYRTEVAGLRREWRVPLPPPNDLPIGEAHSLDRSAWAHASVERSTAVMAMLDDEANFETIELPTPEGGNSFHDATAAECADTLERLRTEGFNVPQYAIDSLRREALEDA